MKWAGRIAGAFATVLMFVSVGLADDRAIILASTTSTENSGLLADLLPRFEERTGIRVHVVAVGTGAALRLGQRGDADVVLIHDRAAEDRFVAAGHGIDRRDVMHNDFLIVGPASDPASIAGTLDAVAALTAIAGARAPFASRGDDSGTHKAERRLWLAAGIDPGTGSGAWYLELGAGMGATLNTAAARGAYTLTDRGTWLSFANRRDLVAVVEGDARLFNSYGVILVNPARHPHVDAPAARAFVDWLTGAEGQAAIAAFTLKGEQLFVPNARDAWK